jgi:DNA-binding FadR family transcriptional regulator
VEAAGPVATNDTATSPAKVADRVAAALRRAIVAGELRAGDALPSERALADTWDVSRASIREAVRRLESWGLVHVRQGSATRVADIFLSAGLELVPHFFEPGAEVDPGILRDLHELRAMLLGWATERATLQADPASVARLDALARKLAEARTAAERQALDYDFFESLVAIGGNRLLQLFAGFVRRIYDTGRARFAYLYEDAAFDASHHRRAVEAMRRRDVTGAGAAMRAHAEAALRVSPVSTAAGPEPRKRARSRR